jgi:hypothetical protein
MPRCAGDLAAREVRWLIGFCFLNSPTAVAAGSSLLQDFQRSLNMLSKTLYTEELHFILELLQNADDNDYPSV